MERMLQFQRVPQEKQREIPDRKPPPEWPTQGVVEFRDVWMRYREGLPPVLKARFTASYDWGRCDACVEFRVVRMRCHEALPPVRKALVTAVCVWPG